MTHIDYFKSMAKKFQKDFKTRTFDEEGFDQYSPQFFKDIDELLVSFDLSGKDLTLMNIQHLIAYLAGFEKWGDLLKASEARLEIGKQLLEHRDEIDRDDWLIYEFNYCRDFPDETKLEIFKAVFLNESEIE